MSSTEQELSQEFTLSDKLYEVSEATNPDGTVDVEITGYDDDGDGNIYVTFRTPTREQQNEVMDFPKRDSRDYKFVRLCRTTVGSLTGADMLNEGGHYVKADPDSWELVIERPRRERAKEFIGELTFVETAIFTAKTLILVMTLLFGAFMLLFPFYQFCVVVGLAPSVMGAKAAATTWILSAIITLVLMPVVQATIASS